MPHVLVKYRPVATTVTDYRRRIRDGVRRAGAKELSVPQLKLTENDFSFGWLKCYDEDINHDVEMVFTGAHDYPERVARLLEINEAIQVEVAGELHADPNDPVLSLSTTITLGPTEHVGGFTDEPRALS